MGRKNNFAATASAIARLGGTFGRKGQQQNSERERNGTRGERTMCAFASRARLLCSGVLTGLACVALTAGAAAQQKSSPPDFSSSQAGWLTFRVEFMAGSRGGAGPGFT